MKDCDCDNHDCSFSRITLESNILIYITTCYYRVDKWKIMIATTMIAVTTRSVIVITHLQSPTTKLFKWYGLTWDQELVGHIPCTCTDIPSTCWRWDTRVPIMQQESFWIQLLILIVAVDSISVTGKIMTYIIRRGSRSTAQQYGGELTIS